MSVTNKLEVVTICSTALPAGAWRLPRGTGRFKVPVAIASQADTENQPTKAGRSTRQAANEQYFWRVAA